MSKSIRHLVITLAFLALALGSAYATQTNAVLSRGENLGALRAHWALLHRVRDHNAAVPDRDATYITFSVPGSVCLPAFGGLCTYPTAINPAGVVTGFYADAIGKGHGFVRSPQGVITKFDVPGSVCNYAFGVNCTIPGGITPSGEISGFYCNETVFTCHGFLRSPGGRFTSFDPPGSVFTAVYGINNSGAVVGFYNENPYNGVHGFVRWPNGAFTAFDPPGSIATNVFAINDAGVIVGDYLTVSASPAFLRFPNGTIITVGPPGSAAYGDAINSAGTAGGCYFANSNSYGFTQTSNGAVSITPPSSCVYWINPAGTAVGYYNQHGFFQRKNGPLTVFDPPSSVSTTPLAINSRGVITGTYTDQNGLGYGFLRFPHHDQL